MKTNFRSSLRVLALILAVALVAGFAALGPLAGANAAPAQAPQAATPLPEAACTLAGTTRICHLWAKTGTILMPDSRSIAVWGFSDTSGGAAQVPGPVIRAAVGETLSVVLHNQISGQQVSLSFVGQEGLVPDLTGVASGSTRTYTFRVQQAGTFLYQAGLTSNGTRQVAMGLVGALVVDDPAPTWDDDLVLVFTEVDPAFHASPATFSMTKFKPRYWLINGQAYPSLGAIDVAAGSTVRLRYVNAGSEHRSIGLLGLSQTMQPGQQSAFPVQAVTLGIAPGMAIDALVEIPASVPAGTLYPLYNTSLHQHNNNQRLADRRAAFGGMLAFLRTTGGGGGGGQPSTQGPVASAVSAQPARATGAAGLTLAATLTDDDSNVVAYETTIDTGAAVAGTVAAPARQVTLSAAIPAARLTGLAQGSHTLSIRGQDANGNWGAASATTFTIDTAGPVVSGTTLSPALSNGSAAVAISATADEAASGAGTIAAGQYRIDGGAWQAMTLAQTGAASTGLSASLPAATITGLADGAHTVEVRAQDDLGNWSAALGSAALTVDKTGPTASAVALAPASVNLSQPLNPVQLTATLTDGLTVAAGEGFIDTVGTPGTGFALAAADGAFEEASEAVSYSIPTATLQTLAVGTHTVYVRGRDAAGNWGATASAALTVTQAAQDTTGPAITGLTVSPNPARFFNTLTITATATDTASNIAGAEWFRGTDPGVGRATAMSAADGSFNSRSESLRATTLVTWAAGTYQIRVRARDAAGNWGPVVTVTLTVR